MVEKRLRKIRQLLKEEELAGVVLVPGVELFYATKLDIHPSERLTAIIIPADEEPQFICPGFEKSRLEKEFNFGEIHPWDENQDPFKLLGKRLKVLDLATKRIALDSKLWFEWFLRIQKVLPKTEFTDSKKIIGQARLTKTEEELKIMRKATQIAAEAITETHAAIEEGMTELDIQKMVLVKLEELPQSKPAFALVQSGPNSALPHGSPTKRKVKKNDPILIDAGPKYRGYIGDITITSVLGKPSKKFEEIYDIVYAANRAAYKAVKEGMVAEAIDKIARDIITDAGYGPYFTHRLGHGIGLETHEPPYLVKDNKQILQAGMCHSIEPGIYIEGEFGIRIEDDVVVKEEGCEFLFEPERKIWLK
jgi:Xaa-Pro dipeptidase